MKLPIRPDRRSVERMPIPNIRPKRNEGERDGRDDRQRTRCRAFGAAEPTAQREMAELDVWYIFGVDRVVNKIQVHP